MPDEMRDDSQELERPDISAALAWILAHARIHQTRKATSGPHPPQGTLGYRERSDSIHSWEEIFKRLRKASCEPGRYHIKLRAPVIRN
jgi:hypothetical protein